MCWATKWEVVADRSDRVAVARWHLTDQWVQSSLGDERRDACVQGMYEGGHRPGRGAGELGGMVAHREAVGVSKREGQEALVRAHKRDRRAGQNKKKC